MIESFPIKVLFAPHRKTIEPSDLGDARVFHYSLPVWHATGDGQEENASDLASLKLHLDGGEILVSKLNPEKGAVVLAQSNVLPLIASTEFIALKPRAADVRYGYWLMQSAPVRAQLEASVESVTNSHKRARVDRFLSSRVSVPDLRTQKRIAAFLNKETARIDALIKKNERLIVLAEEKLRTEIDGVTQKAPGKVRVRMSKVCDYIPGKHLGVESTTTEPGDVRYLRTADLYEDMSFEKSPLWVLEPKPENIVTSEDVIVCFDGFVANGKTGTLGMAVTGASGHVGASLSIVAPRKDPRYSDDLLRLAHLGNAFREVVVKNAEGVTAKHGQRGVRHFDVHLDPDVDTQKHQARDLRRIIEKTSLLKEKLVSFNALLKEKRSALITAAVTGQIDIPE